MTALQAGTLPLVRARVGGPGWDFNAAHTGLHGGQAEPLHGHTYQVVFTACGLPDGAGMVADFQLLKEQLREAIAPLKRRTLIAAAAPGVIVEETQDGQIVVSGGGACFTLPRYWVTMLPIASTSTEALASYLVTELARRTSTACPAVERLELTLSESAECAATAEAVLR